MHPNASSWTRLIDSLVTKESNLLARTSVYSQNGSIRGRTAFICVILGVNQQVRIRIHTGKQAALSSSFTTPNIPTTSPKPASSAGQEAPKASAGGRGHLPSRSVEVGTCWTLRRSFY